MARAVVDECRNEEGEVRRCDACPHAVEGALAATPYGIQRTPPRCKAVERNGRDASPGTP